MSEPAVQESLETIKLCLYIIIGLLAIIAGIVGGYVMGHVLASLII